MADNNNIIAWLRISDMIKEALDNLPCGVCFFDENGVPILVNRVMHSLAFSITKRDIQNISDLDEILAKPDEVISDNGTIWRFGIKESAENGLTELNAVNITDLSVKKRELKSGNNEQQDIISRLEKMSKDVVSVTRNEEILAMKMRIHSELGYALSATRHFISENCKNSEKDDYIALQRNMAKKLLGEVGNDDEPDIFSELCENARKLGMEIVYDGVLPDFAEDIMTKAVRECLINTFRHAHGDKVFVRTKNANGKYIADITNNGKPPERQITEGGGLSSLRKSIEENGGTMTVSSCPAFSLTITLYEKEQ